VEDDEDREHYLQRELAVTLRSRDIYANSAAAAHAELERANAAKDERAIAEAEKQLKDFSAMAERNAAEATKLRAELDATQARRAAARARLAELMDERRRDLRLTWDQVAERGSITYETIRQVRSGKSAIRALTKRGLEVGLAWAQGSVDVVINGGDPVALYSDDQAHVAGRTREADALVESIWASDLPDEDKLEMVEVVLAERAEADRRARERFAERLRMWRRMQKHESS
jgi:hypothetical protein